MKYYGYYRRKGLTGRQSKCKVCQDIMMEKLVNSKLNKNLALKGGTVMYQLTGTKRTPTLDMDFDVIKMAMNIDTIKNIVRELNNSNAFKKIKVSFDETTVVINENKEYYSMSYTLQFADGVDVFALKIDMGVHKNVQIKQNLLPFKTINDNGEVKMVINPPEQMLIEKTTSILMYGTTTTRMRDIFDNYWLMNNYELNDEVLKQCIDLIIIKDGKADSTSEYFRIVRNYYSNKRVKKSLKGAVNWLNIDESVILESLNEFFTNLETRI